MRAIGCSAHAHEIYTIQSILDFSKTRSSLSSGPGAKASLAMRQCTFPQPPPRLGQAQPRPTQKPSFEALLRARPFFRIGLRAHLSKIRLCFTARHQESRLTMNALEALSHTSHVIQTQTCSRHLSPTALQKQAVRDATVKGKQDRRLACQARSQALTGHRPK